MATAAQSLPKKPGGPRRPPKAHPFLPRGLQAPVFLVWLRRTHGWLGIWGALAGILFGITTIVMVHAEIFRTAEDVQSVIQLPVGEALITSNEALGAFVKAELGLTTDARPPRGGMGAAAPGAGAVITGMGVVGGMGGGRRGGMTAGGAQRLSQPVYITQFTSPGTTLDLRYTAGNEFIEITRTERGLMETMNRMHRGNGAQLGWTLLGDAFSGALVVLAISGVLLWSRMDGSRLIAIGLGGAGLLSALYFYLAGA